MISHGKSLNSFISYHHNFFIDVTIFNRIFFDQQIGNRRIQYKLRDVQNKVCLWNCHRLLFRWSESVRKIFFHEISAMKQKFMGSGIWIPLNIHNTILAAWLSIQKSTLMSFAFLLSAHIYYYYYYLWYNIKLKSVNWNDETIRTWFNSFDNISANLFVFTFNCSFYCSYSIIVSLFHKIHSEKANNITNYTPYFPFSIPLSKFVQINLNGNSIIKQTLHFHFV